MAIFYLHESGYFSSFRMPDHHVNKVTLDFFYKKEMEASALQKTRSFFYEAALPALSRVLDEVRENVYIKKLEIEVGITSPEDFSLSFQQALTKALRNLQHEQSNVSSPQAKYSQDEPSEPLLFYLVRGYWPWNYQQKMEEELDAYVDSIFKEDITVSKWLQKISEQEEYVITRFLHLAAAKKKRWRALLQALQKKYPVFESWLNLNSEKILLQGSSSSSFYYRFFLFLLPAPPIIHFSEAKQWLAKLVSFLPALTLKSKNRLLSSIKGPHDRSLPLRLQAVIEELKRQYETSPGKAVEKKSLEPLNTSTLSANQEQDEETEKIAIANAGLILFHPFLPHVFKDLRWIDETKNFVSRKAQQKAVLALQYLINGKSRQAEHAVVLNKLLCNWPMHLPVATATRFSTNEKAALAELSSSLREYWEVLKNTSHLGLIESFVARPGLVQKTTDGYLLQIERKTIDVLLESLPFAINTIKLPWNEYLLHTEW